MRVTAAIVVIGWIVFLVLWGWILLAAPLGRPQTQDWLMELVPIAGIGSTVLAGMFWRRGRRLIGGFAMGASVVALLWILTGMLNLVSLLGNQAPS